MTSNSEKPRSSRSKRREVLLSGVAKLAGCAAVIVTVAGVFFDSVSGWLESRPRLAPVHSGESAAAAAAAAAEAAGPAGEGAAGGIAGLEEKRPRIEATLRRFFAARTVAEKAACSRDPARVTPLMETHYLRHPMAAPPWRKLDTLTPVSVPGYRLAAASVLFTGASPQTVVVEEGDDGTLRVDWEHAVLYSDMPWADFLKKRPRTPALFRVFASRPAAGPAVSAGGELSVLELTHPVEPGSVRGYFKNTDPAMLSLVEQMKPGQREKVPLTLRLSFPGPGADAASVQVAGVEGRGWLILQNTRS